MENRKVIELSVPAERNMLLVVRMTTSGVVSRAGFTLDEMDDMKMAVDEACNLMMLQKSGCQTLKFTYEYTQDMVTMQIEGQDFSAASELNEDMNMQEVIRCILESMVDEVNLSKRADGKIGAICLKKNIPSGRRSAV